MKRTINTLFLMLCSTLVFAQTSITEVNEIKMNPNYLYGEATMNDREESVSLAKELLINHIKEWMANDSALQNVENVMVQDVAENSNIVSLMRGKMYRSFVYAKKQDIIPMADTKNILIVSNDMSTIAQQVPLEPESTIVDSMSQISEPMSTSMQDTLDKIMKIEYSADVVPTFNQLKTEKKITFGKYTTLKSSDDCYLLIYNKHGEVVAILDKGHAKNMYTGTEDSVKNYEGCGAVWFQLL